MSFADRMLKEKKKDLILGLLVAFIAFLVYANSLGNGFVWDDSPVIIYKQALKGDILSLFTAPDRVWDTDPAVYYRPLTYTTFLLEERLHGLNPTYMHLANVLLHAANAFLVFFVARSMISSPYAACIAGILFAVHPIQTETVDFISCRNTLLACFFALSAFLLHYHSMRKQVMFGAVAGAIAILAGLLSKEITLAALPFIVALEFHRTSTGSRRRALMRLLPYLAGTAVYVAMRHNALSHAGISIEITELGSRLLNNVYIIPRYLLTILWPLSLNIRYFVPEDFHPLALQLVAAWGCIFGFLGWVMTRKDRHVSLFGIAWAVAFWLPVSGIIPFPSAPLAERYLYLPAIGLWLIVADRTAWAFSSSPVNIRRYVATVVGLALVLVLGSLTIARNFDWKDNLTLFSRYVEQNPDIAFGHQFLGSAYIEKTGDLDAAEREFKAALALDPSIQTLYNPLGTIRLQKGDFEGALLYFTEALGALPVDQDARIKRGMIYEKLGRRKEALMDYRLAISISGEYSAPGSRAYAEERVRELSR